MLEKLGKQNVEEDCSQMEKIGWFALEGRGDHLTSQEGLAALPFLCRIRAEVCYWALQSSY